MNNHMPVINTVFNRSLCPTVEQARKYGEFLRGWSCAKERITPEETFAQVDKLKERGLKYSHFDVGVLYGRVKSYQGLIYLNQELPLPKELWNVLSKNYD